MNDLGFFKSQMANSKVIEESLMVAYLWGVGRIKGNSQRVKCSMTSHSREFLSPWRRLGTKGLRDLKEKWQL